MKTLNSFRSVLIAALVAMSESAYGTQPPDVVESDAENNTAMGTTALLHLTSGTYNTATGIDALLSNTSGFDDTASGALALGANTIGYQNSAFGASALQGNMSGSNNTASGVFALYANATGAANTASGAFALYFNTGDDNTASGYGALYFNTTADYNTASGFQALYSNNGGSNTASGYEAMYANTSGLNNTATGVHALASNTTGSNNVADGWHAGYNLTTGSNNIDIGTAGSAGDANTIKIGIQNTQTKTIIAVSGAAVMINSAGQLGAVVSSERFKTAITPMGSNSAKLGQLRPVTFHLKTEPHGALQYGLIAEEVAEVYPDLVVRNESGRIDSVRYDELAPMLLNETQLQQRRIVAQDARYASLAAQIRTLKQQLASQAEQLRGMQQRERLLAAQTKNFGDVRRQMAALVDLKQELRAVLLKLRAKNELLAQR
jgi:hypothetical protein